MLRYDRQLALVLAPCTTSDTAWFSLFTTSGQITERVYSFSPGACTGEGGRRWRRTTSSECYPQELLCSVRRTHAATQSIGYVTSFCLPNMNDRRDRRFKLEPTLPPDGFSVIFSDDTPTNKQMKKNAQRDANTVRWL